jgi:hypothetical protein
MEVDQGVQAALTSLLQLAKLRLALVVQCLTTALETLSKVDYLSHPLHS